MDITVTKKDDFYKWYNQLVVNCNFIKYTDIPGCYVLLPNSFAIWENIKNYLDINFKKRGVQNTYFPLLISRQNLEKESEHIDGFKPEVAWITKTGDKELDENNYLALRPTSETAIYSLLPDMIESHNDLPLKLNQWCNVVRWEFKDATPFIRSREFLWNEGHTCYSTEEEAIWESQQMLKLYNTTYNSKLAVPTILGIKTEKEKFAGANRTYTIETFIPEIGKGIQCCTVHNLGQNFSKIFDISFRDKSNKEKYVWQNSWGFTTRSIGTMLMIHGDDKGAIIPPMIANIQVVIIPIHNKKSEKVVKEYIEDLTKTFDTIKLFSYKVDYSNHNPGWKYNYWERLGVPLRIEIGPRDVKNETITMVCRHNGYKASIKKCLKIENIVNDCLITMQNNIYERAFIKMKESIAKPEIWEDFVTAIDSNKMCLIPFCNKTSCEDKIKEKSYAKSLCIPIEDEYTIKKIDLCIHCGKEAIVTCLFGRSF